MQDALEPAGSGFDYLFKFIILGESSTGKSTLLHQFIHHEFTPKSHTVGVEFTSRLLLLDPSSPAPGTGGWGEGFEGQQQREASGSRGGSTRKASAVKLQIWDSAGQERFRSVTRSYFRAASGALLVYDVTKRSTFDNLPRWLADVRSLASENLVVAIVGNKTDLADADASPASPDDEHASPASSSSSPPRREVTREEASEWAASQGCLFAETSSLTGENVEAPFKLCARGVLDLIEGGVVVPDQQGSGVSYGDRLLRPAASRSNSKANHRLSFADIVQSGGGVSRRAARGNTGGGGLIRVKEALGMDRDGGCC